MVTVIHSIHFPVSARSFVEPMVKHLNQVGVSTELWLEYHSKHSAVIDQIQVPKRFVESNLTGNPLKFWKRLNLYRQALRIAQPLILHTHQTRASIIPLLAAFLEKIPVRIYHNHGLPYLGYRGVLRGLLRMLEVINIRLATHVLLVSDSNLEAARTDQLLAHDQGHVLAYGSAVGLDLDGFHLSSFDGEARSRARSKYGVPEDVFVLVYVGRPVKRKGFHLLLKAWERSRLGNQNHVLLVAGCTAAECHTALKRSIAGVKGLGYLTDLQDFYAACDAVILPSYHEGFPYALLEGAAAAKPLIATDIPGLRCAVQHQTTGLLVPRNDEIALAQAIVEIALDPELRSRLGKNARKRVEREFSRDLLLENLLRFYQTQSHDVLRAFQTVGDASEIDHQSEVDQVPSRYQEC